MRKSISPWRTIPVRQNPQNQLRWVQTNGYINPRRGEEIYRRNGQLMLGLISPSHLGLY